MSTSMKKAITILIFLIACGYLAYESNVFFHSTVENILIEKIHERG